MTMFSKSLNKLAVGVGWSMSGKFIGRSLSILGDLIAARILGPDLFGLYAIGWTLFRMCSLVVHLGLPIGVQRYIPIYAKRSILFLYKTIKQSLVLTVFSGLVFGGLLYYFSPFLANNIYQKPGLEIIFKLFSLSFPFISLLYTASSITRSTQIIKYSTLIEDIGQPLLGLICLAFFYFTAGAWVNGVIFSDLLSFIVTSLITLWVIGKLFPGFSKVKTDSIFAMKELLSFSIPTTLAGTFAVFLFWVDRLLVGYFLSATENGLYQAASQLSVIFVVILYSFNAILAPMFSTFFANNEHYHLNEIFRVATKWGLYISLPVFLVVCFAPYDLLSFTYGSAYSGAWLALVILSIGQIVNVGTGAIGLLLPMTGNHRYWLFLSIIGLGLNIILCILLIPSLGIVGAALGTSISLNVIYFAGLLWVSKNLKIWPYDRRYLKGFAALLISAIILFGFEKIYAGGGMVFLLILTLLAFTSFFGVLLLLGLDDEDRHILKLLRLPR